MTEPKDRKTEWPKDKRRGGAPNSFGTRQGQKNKRRGAALAATGEKTRAPRKATPKYLENAALHYLSRFATSAENLKRVMVRKVDRSAHYHGTDAEEGRAHVDGLIGRYLDSGLLDDAAYARSRAESLHRRGNSARMVRAKLRQKGVAGEDIENALLALGKDGGEDGDEYGGEDGRYAELQAAVNFARRRRLGPFAVKPPSGERREKQLASLARAGFSYDIARRVVEAESVDDI